MKKFTSISDIFETNGKRKKAADSTKGVLFHLTKNYTFILFSSFVYEKVLFIFFFNSLILFIKSVFSMRPQRSTKSN